MTKSQLPRLKRLLLRNTFYQATAVVLASAADAWADTEQATETPSTNISGESPDKVAASSPLAPSAATGGYSSESTETEAPPTSICSHEAAEPELSKSECSPSQEHAPHQRGAGSLLPVEVRQGLPSSPVTNELNTDEPDSRRSPDHDVRGDGFHRTRPTEISLLAGDRDSPNVPEEENPLSDGDSSAIVITSPAILPVPENTTLVAALTAAGIGDIKTTHATFTITGGDTDLFNIVTLDGIHWLEFKAPPDFEAGRTTYAVRVSVTDGTHTASRILTIDVRDINEAPTAVTLSSTSVQEGAPGGIIGKIEVTDPDRSDAHTYQLSDMRFEVVDGILKLKSGVSLDYEAVPAIPLTITVTDKGGLSKSQNFEISVEDIQHRLVGRADQVDVFDTTYLNSGADYVITEFKGLHVLRFDDVETSPGTYSEARVPDGYGGFKWLSAGVYDTKDKLGSYSASSGTKLGFIAEAADFEVSTYSDTPRGTPATLIRDEDFDFVSVVLSPAFRIPITVHLKGYDASGQLVGQATCLVENGTTRIDLGKHLDFGNFLSLRKLELTADDGNPETSDYFGFDDFVFAPSVSRDRIKVSIPGVREYSDLISGDYFIEEGADTVIGVGASSVRLVNKHGLHAGDFLFVL